MSYHQSQSMITIEEPAESSKMQTKKEQESM